MDEGKFLEMVRQVIREEFGALRVSLPIAEDAVGALKLPEAAKALSMSVRTLRRKVRAGALLTTEIDGSVRVPVSEIRRVLSPPSLPPLEQRQRAQVRTGRRATSAAMPELAKPRQKASMARAEADRIRSKYSSRGQR